MKLRLFLFVLVLSAFVSLQSCRDHDNVTPKNEEELITTVQLHFKKRDAQGIPTGEPIVFTWRDEDASGNPEIDAIELVAHSEYTMEIVVLDESKNPTADISEEILEEAKDHQFFFEIQGAELTVQYDDQDEEGKPIGLKSIITTEHFGTGTLTVTLRHEPLKSAAGVSDGDITNAGGETDIETTFPVTIVE